VLEIYFIYNGPFIPTEITMETSVQVKEETSEQTSVADNSVVEKSEFFFLGILKI
jgi:hypothetical protein